MLNDKQWMRIMRYIREVPGTVYEEQLDDIYRAVSGERPDGQINVNLLNGGCPSFPEGRRYLKADPVTGGIYTIPGQRKTLDKAEILVYNFKL